MVYLKLVYLDQLPVLGKAPKTDKETNLEAPKTDKRLTLKCGCDTKAYCTATQVNRESLS